MTRDAAQLSAMLCPVCHVGLAMTDRQGVEIDYCPQCRGVWLERSAGGMTPPPPAAQPSYRPDRAHYDHGPSFQKKRKKSFLEELFD